MSTLLQFIRFHLLIPVQYCLGFQNNNSQMQNYTRLKDQGNQLFKDKKYHEAISTFQSAIDLIIKQQPKQQLSQKYEVGKLYVILNINAAFAGLNLKTKQSYAQVENYCNQALKADPFNQKGLYRRAIANKELAELIQIESKGSAQELLTLYNKSKKDFEELTIIDRKNEVAKQKLSEVIKNIYRVTITQGKEVNLSEESKPGEVEEKKPKTKLEEVKVKKGIDMDQILKEYRVEEVTSIARSKIQQQYLTEEMPKNRAELEKAIREIQKSKEVFLKFAYRLTEEYMTKMQPNFDMLFKLIEVIVINGEGEDAKRTLWLLKNQKAFGLLWKGYTNGEKATFRSKWQSLKLDPSELK